MKLGGLVEEYYNPIYSTGIGLVLYGAQRGEVPENLRKTKGPERLTGFMDRMKSWLKEFF
jgi:hypothetical protein